ncbi:hypothetical protein CYMTET_33792 [Cymbomonas tetramitiformis]|uniref:Uncharacterized protein n=1 Tax=Cymbomonas tetramitiformis TaxID=36881 RepID=A0AAE0FCB2_9CHLO|nr:hypothetical protein CYMTET_33792 [Cymbomonas tetramitiformis]
MGGEMGVRCGSHGGRDGACRSGHTVEQVAITTGRLPQAQRLQPGGGGGGLRAIPDSRQRNADSRSDSRQPSLEQTAGLEITGLSRQSAEGTGVPTRRHAAYDPEELVGGRENGRSRRSSRAEPSTSIFA